MTFLTKLRPDSNSLKMILCIYNAYIIGSNAIQYYYTVKIYGMI